MGVKNLDLLKICELEDNGLSTLINKFLKLTILNAYKDEIIKENEIDIDKISNYIKSRIIKKLINNLGFTQDLVCSSCGMEKSSYFDGLKQKRYLEKVEKEKEMINAEYNKHNKHIGVNLIKEYIKKDYGVVINAKKIRKIMHEAGIKYVKKPIKKYSSYMGEGEITKKDLVGREFIADRPLQKIATDVMQLNYSFGKTYFQCYYDLFNREILVYNISLNDSDSNTLQMLENLNRKYGSKLKGAIIHSDNGHQYTNSKYAEKLKEYGIEQSLGRVGNCLDNSAYESFNRIIKEEIYADKYKFISSFEQLIYQLDTDIKVYNNISIRECLGYKSPVEYRINWSKLNNENK